MGVIKFRLASPDYPGRVGELRKAFFVGIDRSPVRLHVDVRGDLLTCRREQPDSGRLFVPRRVEGHGTPYIGTATLAERDEPYWLDLELARGKLNDLRNQCADWKQMGLRTTVEFEALLADAQHEFVKAATSGGDAESIRAHAGRAIALATTAGEVLARFYATQVLQTRLSATPRLQTELSAGVDVSSSKAPWLNDYASAFNAARVNASWRSVAPNEGKYRWEPLDALVAKFRRFNLPITFGPLVDFRGATIPDWLSLFEGDFETLQGLILDYVAQVVTRYRGKVAHWRLFQRAGLSDALGLSEEEQIRIATQIARTTRQIDASAGLSLGVDRPWAEWLSAGDVQLGPLHLADYLVRAQLGISAVAVEIAPGYTSPGSRVRDMLEFSKLLDLYALINVPLHIEFAFPSAAGPDATADPKVEVEPSQWESGLDENEQLDWASRWVTLAASKPFVRTITWLDAADAAPKLYPHSGLFRPDGTAKPIYEWLKVFRKEILVP